MKVHQKKLYQEIAINCYKKLGRKETKILL